MGLRGKFSLLLSTCVVVAVFLTTLATTRFFASEQESLIVDFQTNRASYLEHRLTEKFALLHSQTEAVLKESEPLKKLLQALPAVSGGELWEGENLLASIPPEKNLVQPPLGMSPWAFSSSSANTGTPTVRWIGRYGAKTLVLSLEGEWFSDIFHSERGAIVQIAHPNGNVLVQTDLGSGTALPSFFNEFVYAKMASRQPGMPESVKYRSEAGAELLGTFLRLGTEPPILITLHTPTAVVAAAIVRTYSYTAGIALVFLGLTLTLGMIFSAGLTQPLRELDQQTREVAQGHFDLPLVRNASRADEVGSLARSFARMGQDLKKVHDELQRAERLAALGKFSASIAHEIKNPLGGILINTQLAEEQLRTNPIDVGAVKTTLGFVRDETWRADRIVKSLMKFARQEKAPLKQIDLKDRAKKTLASLKAVVDRAQVHLVLRLPDTPVRILGDDDQIHEVIVNLVQNAIYAMRESTTRELTVTLSVSTERLALAIRDSGAGMTEEVKQHLFEPFYTTKPIGEGTGLGLSVCHGILKSHGGKIEVDSAPQSGTTFTLVFPSPATEAQAA